MSLRETGDLIEMVCPQGHRWQAAAPSGLAGSVATLATGAASPTVACPECGAESALSSGLNIETILETAEPKLGPLFPEDEPLAAPGFEILAPLGRGGMGVVYKARQARPERIVALKVLRRPAAGAALVARFRQEAEAAAKLEHPHIVRVYEVGQTADLQYIAMEYLPCGSLADRLQKGAVSPREAAKLLRDLARAVAFAHERGVLHRDLKPANVLLAADGSPKIADFGLAKQLESLAGDDASAKKLAGLTKSGEVIGTPNYMAPEQATGGARRAGPACDIFALGVILYEMLCQRRPFVGQDTVDILVRVATEEPVPIRRLSPKAPRDLETICLKCLQKAPAKRYETAGALADDLDRFLNGEPIVARPVGAVERGLKWSRRRPAAALALLFAILAPLALAAGWWWHTSQLGEELARTQTQRDRANAQTARADAQRARADAQRDRANAQRDRAEANLASAQAAIDELLDPDGAGFVSASASQRRELLNWALAFCRRLQVANPDSPALEFQSARALRQQADIHRLLGDGASARRAYEQSIERLRRLGAGGEKSDRKLTRELATALNNAGVLLVEQGEIEASRKGFEESIALYRRLAASAPESDDLTLRLAAAMANRAAALEEAGDYQSATAGYQASIERQQAQKNVSAAGRRTLAETQVRLAGALAKTELFDQAKETYESAIADLQALEASQSDPLVSRALGAAHHNRALLLTALGEAEPAAKDYERAIALFAALSERDPEDRSHRRMLAESRLNLGFLYWEGATGRGRCEPLWVAAHADYERLATDAPGDFAARLGLARSLGALARLRIATGERIEGERELLAALQRQEALAAEFPSRAEALSELAMLEREAGVSLRARRATADAHKYLERAVRSEEAALAKQPRSLVFASRLAGHVSELAQTYLEQGDVAAAARAADRLATLDLVHEAAALRAAELFARCLPLAGVLKGDASTGDKPLKEWCAERCAALLQEGLADGRIAPASIAASTDLAPARELPEIRKLIESLSPKTDDSP